MTFNFCGWFLTLKIVLVKYDPLLKFCIREFAGFHIIGEWKRIVNSI